MRVLHRFILPALCVLFRCDELDLDSGPHS